MTVILTALVAAFTGFVTGWYGRGWWVHSEAHRKVVDVVKPKFTAFGVAYFVMFAVIVGSILYNNTRTDDKISASEARQIEETRAAVACLSKTFQEFLVGNQKLRDASERRDKALLGSKVALRELIYQRVILQVDNSVRVQELAEDYLAQTKDFIDASEALNKARAEYELPDFEKLCGKLPKALLKEE